MGWRTWKNQDDDYRPITSWGSYPVDATTLLALAHVAAMIVAALLLSANIQGWIPWLEFNPATLKEGRVWTLATYAFVYNIGKDYIWFAYHMLLFFWFGRELERFIGRHSFLKLYGILLVFPPLLFATLSFLPPYRWLNIHGGEFIHFGVFIGYAMLYPSAPVFFFVVAMWAAWILLGINSLFYLVGHDWVSLVQLWFSTVLAYVYMKYIGVGSENPLSLAFDKWRAYRARQHSAKNLKVVQREKRQTQNIDAILEKISRSGMQSLTEDERRDLEKASRRLQERDSIR